MLLTFNAMFRLFELPGDQGSQETARELAPMQPEMKV
jgi:hypothetical protein